MRSCPERSRGSANPVVLRGWRCTAVVAAAAIGLVAGQAVPEGPEFLISEPKPSAEDYGYPAVTLAEDGSAVFAFKDGEHTVHTRSMSTSGELGEESFLVGFTGYEPRYPRMAEDALGRGVVVWNDNLATPVHGRLFRSNGNPDGDPFVLVDSIVAGNLEYVDVAMAASGEFVVVWSRDNGPDPETVVARRFDADAVPLGPEFVLQEPSPFRRTMPMVSMNASGAFVVVWRSHLQESIELVARRFDSTGQPVGPEFTVNTETHVELRPQDVALNDTGRLAVLWTSRTGIGEYHLFARHFDGAAPLAGEVLLERSVGAGEERDTVVASIDSSGRGVVLWHTPSPSLSYMVEGAVFAGNGLPAGETFLPVAMPPSWMIDPAVDMASDGDFVVVWQQRVSFENVIQGRRYHLDLPPTCSGPTTPVVLSSVRLSDDGQELTVLTIDDASPTGTGYNVYRFSDPSTPRPGWTLRAWDQVDSDPVRPSVQWVDPDGNPPPGGIWYYDAVAFDHTCPAEGPR